MSGDYGWGDDTEATGMRPLGTLALLLASSAYAASLWLSYGFPPLHRIATRVRAQRPKA